ncbi:hypothetical protein JCM4914_71850 [Streptomyces platensis subsp. malvinus]
MTNDVDTLATALYATTNDILKEHPDYFGRGFERELSEHGVQLLQPARKGEGERPGAALFKPLREVIASINETFKGQLDLEPRDSLTSNGTEGAHLQVSKPASCNASSR